MDTDKLKDDNDSESKDDGIGKIFFNLRRRPKWRP